MWTSPEDRCIQGAREHGETNKLALLNVRAYHIDTATNLHHKEPKFNIKDNIRTFLTHLEHEELSWLSCKYHWCKEHRQNKEDNDCFPVMIPGTPNDKPYLATETEGYLEPLIDDTSSEDTITDNELKAINEFFKKPHEIRGKPTDKQKKAWRQWCRYELELMKERQELSEVDHIEGYTDPEKYHQLYLENIGALHKRQMTEEERYEARLKTPEEQYEELEIYFQ
ncbi:uncharacterized protein FRV6_11869 [Fusarium oxysporum]|uniref:Uncharacterized protein n=1 Tax=Fusarium oxysporum TaxID=5507 RepID=A0A2H3TGE5_FUSOX|nr:uncharacterized protein FRV6_11869 [Fusarium oxysporum]